MRKADSGLRRLMQDHLPKPDWHWTPVETGGTHNGVPDSHYIHRPTHSAGWVECKATDGWAVKMEPHQVKWLTVATAAGVTCSVAVRARGVGSAAGKGDALWLLQGHAADVIASEGLRLSAQHVLGVWYGPPRTWNWDDISSILRR